MSDRGGHAVPSGEQFEITRGSDRAVVGEVGATLRVYSADGVDVVDGFPREEMCSAGRGQILAPWPNRLDEGRYSFQGREGRAAFDEPERSNAIHGLVRWLPWHMRGQGEGSVELGCTLHPQPGYPWRLELGVTYRLGADGLSVTTTARNLCDVAAPFGIGFHPYLSAGGPIEEARLLVPASRRLITDERGLPVGDEHVAGGPFDFTERRPIGSSQLETAYTDLTLGEDGCWRAELEHPDGVGDATLWGERGFGYLMVYTGDTLEPVSRRRRAVALEPSTCPPNALRSGDDVVRLDPGMGWEGTWGIAPRRGAPGPR